MESVAVSYSATASAFFSLPSTPLAPSSSIGIVLKGRSPRKNSFSVSSLSKTLEKSQLSSSSSSKAVYSSARRAAIAEVKGASIDLDSALSRVEGVLQLEDYNIILRYFGESRKWSEMSQLFEWMQRNEKLNFVSYSSFFKYIGINRDPAKALQVYESIPDELMKVNVSVCNSFLGCMVRNGRHESSLKFFNQMKDDGLTPDLITYSTLLAGCAKLKCGYSRAMELVQEIKSKDLHMDSVIYGNLLAICASNNLSEEAEMYFQKMKNEGYKPNLFHYSSLLNVYAMKRNHMKAEKLVNDMKSSGLAPNKVILTTLLKVYARGGLFEKSKELFAELRALGYAGDEIPYCLLIDSLAKAGHIRDAKLLFADMKEKGVKSDGYSYSIMISALCRSGLLQEAKKLAQEFEASYEKYDLVMLNTLLRTYCNAGDMESVMKMLRKMDELTISPDWNTFHILIKYFCKEKLYHLAYKTTEDMHGKGHQLNEDLCSSVILQLGEAGFTSEAFSVYNMLRYSKRTICKSLHERMLRILVAAGFLKDAYVVMKDNMEVISMHSLERFCISFIKSGNINMINDVLKAFHRSGNKIDPDIFHTAISRYIRMPDKKELLLQLLEWMSGQGYCVDSLSRNLLLKNSHLFGPKQLIAEILSKQKIMSRKLQTQKKIIASSKTLKVGPWGGNGGNTWDDGSYNGVREITMAYGKCIDSIMIEYDKNGKPVLAEKHGGTGGNHTIQIKLKYPDEFLTAISGHYAPVVRGGSSVIRALTFKSNQRTFGPFGTEEGTPFSFPMDGGTIVGFSGGSGWYLDAIGLHLSPLRTANIYDTVHYKLQKLGTMAYKSLGRRNGQHESPVDSKTQKAHG